MRRPRALPWEATSCAIITFGGVKKTHPLSFIIKQATQSHITLILAGIPAPHSQLTITSDLIQLHLHLDSFVIDWIMDDDGLSLALKQVRVQVESCINTATGSRPYDKALSEDFRIQLHKAEIAESVFRVEQLPPWTPTECEAAIAVLQDFQRSLGEKQSQVTARSAAFDKALKARSDFASKWNDRNRLKNLKLSLSELQGLNSEVYSSLADVAEVYSEKPQDLQFLLKDVTQQPMSRVGAVFDTLHDNEASTAPNRSVN